ncbi:MAG: chromosome partitioning protein ParB [Rhodospirillaceae bacterium]|jgi:ParB family chromosome partitioning protein|nr:chromosome partitioning protein ParB [Rhodospirillaceae bacterium]|tara:strand:+ start:10849 stop:11745 length:897 start_codon:yes stop_codon:yes gene_type:complete
MAKDSNPIKVQMVPVENINVQNPRARNQKAFRLIIDSIASVGLKKPITVALREKKNSDTPYDLVCGQGRLEAFKSLGESEIPAIVIDVAEEEALVMSLVENLARRQHQPLELLHDIGVLKKRRYSDRTIAKKTGLSYEYVHAICHLLEEGEERLLAAVESGQIPVSVAIDIAEADEEGVQEALADAYQSGHLRGKKLLIAKKLVERRHKLGKALKPGGSEAGRIRVSSENLVRAYEREADRQRLIIKKAEITQNRLLFIVEAARKLLADENFTTLLRAEGLETMPRPLADLVTERGTR